MDKHKCELASFFGVGIRLEAHLSENQLDQQNLEKHLFPFIFREHLNNPDGLVKSLESVGIDTTSFRINILNSLWVNP